MRGRTQSHIRVLVVAVSTRRRPPLDEPRHHIRGGLGHCHAQRLDRVTRVVPRDQPAARISSTVWRKRGTSNGLVM